MTKLRERMLEDLSRMLSGRGYAKRTQDMYIRAVRKLAEHYHKSPDQITEEELRDYFLYVKNTLKWSRTASTIALCGIKFFYQNTIKRDWPTLTFVRARARSACQWCSLAQRFDASSFASASSATASVC